MEIGSGHRFEIQAFLQNDLDQDAAFLTEVLSDIREVIEDHDDLARKIPFCIKEKGERDKNQLNQLVSYQGPDDQTLRILSVHEELWKQQPWKFWETPLLSSSDEVVIPQAQIARYYLHGQDVDA
ncbi:hypothetical protein H2200_007902 [Cladophialophora chaetospira]|uniref:Uncharacterized protein n=1 Tax=Cladophialophora chaetospira TaxID=386627 RepID=A0AA38X755_9EURO|nr:hypothetical protein H2200_007902 [Cladophialophora chaetospira]